MLFAAGPSRSYGPRSVEESNVSVNLEETRVALRHLAKKYHSQISTLLDPYVGSNEAFRALNGQAEKTAIVKFLIRENHRLDSTISPPMRCLGLNTESPLLLVTETKLDQILDWYTQTIFSETKSWLAKTIANAWQTRTNKFDLPWDVSLADDQYVSNIPETYRFQLNVYLDLCSQKPKPRYLGDTIDSKEVERVLQVDQNFSNYVSALNKASVTQVNDKILKSIGECLCLLAEEFRMALQVNTYTRTHAHTHTEREN